MNKLILVFLFSSVLVGCSSTESKRSEVVQKDYIVRDASTRLRPSWIDAPEEWAKNNGKNSIKNRFFSLETRPKDSKNIACNLAKASAKSEMAQEIIKSLSSIERSSETNKYIETTLSPKVESLIHGASIVKTYWEKRQYKKSLGSRRDFKGYTCAVFIKMSSDRLNEVVKEASDLIVKSVKGEKK